ncbi:hypothetical protein, partial [Acetobacter estunensis]|uniref:hypothetical protein n=1 Tax=Acetobacter estunensis TaxID=104097 RepID=UPI001C2CE520
LDVQRHALSLKPVLTSVDAERYLNATPSNILRLPETDTLLLSLRRASSRRRVRHPVSFRRSTCRSRLAAVRRWSGSERVL